MRLVGVSAVAFLLVALIVLLGFLSNHPLGQWEIFLGAYANDTWGLSEIRRQAGVVALNVSVVQEMPPANSGGKVKMLIGVMSSPENFARRTAIRRSWFQEPAIVEGVVKAKFFLGKSSNETVNEEAMKEANAYGDIVLLDLKEDYYSIANKTAEIFFYGARQVDPEFVMKCDDDTYVYLQRILEILENHPTQGLYFGKIKPIEKPSRDPKDKWFVSIEDYPEEYYPLFAHGPGFIVSRDLVDFFATQWKQDRLRMFLFEDVAVGFWVDGAIKDHGMKVSFINDDNFIMTGCTSTALIGHYITPKHMSCIWRRLKRKETPACCQMGNRKMKRSFC